MTERIRGITEQICLKVAENESGSGWDKECLLSVGPELVLGAGGRSGSEWVRLGFRLGETGRLPSSHKVMTLVEIATGTVQVPSSVEIADGDPASMKMRGWLVQPDGISYCFFYRRLERSEEPAVRRLVGLLSGITGGRPKTYVEIMPILTARFDRLARGERMGGSDLAMLLQSLRRPE